MRLKDIVPWHLRGIFRATQSFYAKRRPPFVGVYSGFGEVGPVDAYDEAAWARGCVEALSPVLSQDGQPVPSVELGKAFLPLLIASMPGRPRVLDYGGGAGLDYVCAKVLSGREVDYHVVEVPAVCDAGRKHWGGAVTFHESVPVGLPFDVVYAYSSIHTAPDFKAVLQQISKLGAEFILLGKHPVYGGPSFVRAQVNLGHGKRHAQWVMNRGDIESALPGYTLAFCVAGEENYNVDNFAPEYRVPGCANILFKRSPE